MPGLDAMARLEAEEAHPPAADRAAARLVAPGHTGQLVEEREQVVIGPRHADGLGAQQRAAPRPRADQGERAVLSAEDERGPGGRDGHVERFAEQRGGHGARP
jgi:hypothetical protein